MTERLRDLVAAELAEPVDARVTAMAEALAEIYPGAARAVLFYGSCLREAQLDGLMLDFYLIVSDYRAAFGRGWFAFANRILPPNVFPFEHEGLAAKYAVLSEADFARLCSVRAKDVSVWARFVQPARLVWAADADARAKAASSVALAPLTMAMMTLPMMVEGAEDPLALWRRGFELTYSAELRAERGNRPATIVDSSPDYYRKLTDALLAEWPSLRGALIVPASGRAIWRRFRRRGKVLTLLRLAKATTTYAGGVDYIAWKINRHAGTKIVVKPWQRRWPILGGLVMLPRLLRRGAIR